MARQLHFHRRSRQPILQSQPEPPDGTVQKSSHDTSFFLSSGGQCIYEYPEMAQQPEWPEERCAQRSFYWVAAVVVQLAKPCMQRARHEALFEETIG
jgi:hypothetical protein